MWPYEDWEASAQPYDGREASAQSYDGRTASAQPYDSRQASARPSEEVAHHAFIISGGPYGPIPGTHVFPRSATVGDLVAKLLETTAVEADPYTFGNVNVDPGGYYRGENEITLPADLPQKQRDGLKIADTWNGLRKRLRARRGIERLDEYHANNPERERGTKSGKRFGTLSRQTIHRCGFRRAGLSRKCNKPPEWERSSDTI